MKFGQRIEAEAVRSGHPDHYFAYNKIKKLVKEHNVEGVQQAFQEEVCFFFFFFLFE